MGVVSEPRGFEIQIAEKDFEKANAILVESVEDSLDNVEEGYYLLDFSDEELHDIILKPEEWNEYDVSLAEKLLTHRGKPVDPAKLSAQKKARMEALAQPDEFSTNWKYGAYLAMFVFVFPATLLGWLMWKSTKTLPNGKNVPRYDVSTRNHGARIFKLSLVLLILGTVLAVLRRILMS